MKKHQYPNPLGSIIVASLKRVWHKTEARTVLSSLIFNWSTLMGEPLGSTTQVEAFQRGVLHLSVAHGHELSVRYQEKEICDRLNTWLKAPHISSLRLKSCSPWKKALPTHAGPLDDLFQAEITHSQGEVGRTQGVRAKEVDPMSNTSISFRQALEAIRDPVLRETLTQLGEKALP